MSAEKVVRLETGKVYEQIEKFLKKKERKSQNTAKSYEIDIKKFFKIVKNKELPFLNESDVKITLDDIEDYIEYLHDHTELNNKTINRRVTSVKELLRYLKLKKLVEDIDFLEFIERLPESENKIGILTVEETKEMAMLAKLTERNLKNIKYSLIRFALDTGIRRSALLSIKWSDFEKLENGKIILRTIDKGNKLVKKEIGLKLYEELKLLRVTHQKDEKVFKISIDAVNEMIPRLVKKMGLPPERNISFHSIRKCCINFSYKKTGDIMEAKKVAGHANLNTTAIYINEEDYGSTGIISSEDLDEFLFEKVSHHDLLQAIRELKSVKLLLNLKLQENKNKQIN